MKKIILILVLALFSSSAINAQNDGQQDAFTPISKYIQSGDYERLSAWFADNMELDILGSINDCTRNQAKMIMKNFFSKYTPKKFNIIHKSGKAPMKYAVGTLTAGGERFRVILYVKTSDDGSYLEQLKVEQE